MYRVHLTEQQHQELHKRAHQKNSAPRTRDRLEMVRLSDMGWSIPKIAAHLRQHPQTVRYWIKAFLDRGFEALSDKPHTGKKSAITQDILTTVKAWLTQGDRTWNARQIAQEVSARYGICRSVQQWRRLLVGQHLTYKRTKRSLRHKQNPTEVETKRADLDILKRGPIAGK